MKLMRIVSLVVVIISAMLFLPCIDASTHIVGDGLNWVEPPIITTYSIWASTHVFVRGDFLVFKFNSGIHDVAEVTKKGYKRCNTSSTISIHATSPVKIPLPKSGKRYFISTLNNDCRNGLKLPISVLSRLPPPPPPGPPPAIAPSATPTSSTSAPPLSNQAPNDPIITPPPPSHSSSAPLVFGHVSLSSMFVYVLFGLVCEFIV